VHFFVVRMLLLWLRPLGCIHIPRSIETGMLGVSKFLCSVDPMLLPRVVVEIVFNWCLLSVSAWFSRWWSFYLLSIGWQFEAWYTFSFIHCINREGFIILVTSTILVILDSDDRRKFRGGNVTDLARTFLFICKCYHS
jgi:hypothetical protein